MGWLRHLFGDRLPEGFPGTLDRGEDVLGVAEVAGGGHLIVTQLGLWIPTPDGARRVGWHLVAKAAWADGVFTLTEAEEARKAGKAVILADRAPVRFTLEAPARVPLLVRQRVDGSIRSRYRKELMPGGAWFVWRKVPGTDTVVLQVRPDAGTDLDVVAAIASEASAKMANPEL
ncbi:MAG: hypothetical protein QOI21_2534 [Actinomycetota bacterium]|jgi:hypothetical protein|nr:hypothetical protein [Actinomycetota bacterium]